MKDSTQKEIEKALKALDKHSQGAASEWWEYRHQSHYTHIVDPSTGKWVSQFEANGTTYYVRSPITGIGMKRYTEMMKRLPAIGFDDTFQQLADGIRKAIEAANTIGSKEQKLSDLFVVLNNMYEGIRRSDRQWQMSYIIATLFIVRKDEDISSWSIEDAHTKIEDWNAAKIHERDFFFLVMYWRGLLAKWYEPLPGRIKELVQEWTPLS